MIFVICNLISFPVKFTNVIDAEPVWDYLKQIFGETHDIENHATNASAFASDIASGIGSEIASGELDLSRDVQLNDVHSAILDSIYKSFPELKKSNFLDNCLVNVAPLSCVYEFEVDGERVSICAQNPYRTSSWFVEDCQLMCRDIKINDQIDVF